MGTKQFIFALFGSVALLSICGYWFGKWRLRATSVPGQRAHSRPDYYGWYTVLWLVVPSIGLAVLSGVLHIFSLPSLPPGLLLFAALGLGGAGDAVALATVRPGLRARSHVERTIMAFLVVASLVSIITTVGIVASILWESVAFFKKADFWYFLGGTQWTPGAGFLESMGRAGEGASQAKFGSLPIFAGTFLITAIAMVVAVPVGLFAAIYMAEYAPLRLRRFAKPALEILAGIPTVVYGFFAAITVSPLVVHAADWLRDRAIATFDLGEDAVLARLLDAAQTNALAPGLVMGIMIIPLVSSLSDDVISAVPNNLREGSLALGMTMSETVKKVVLPAALPGIVSAVLLAISRALGETMIVVMAAGQAPNLTINPLKNVTTVTVSIVSSLTGDKSFDSPETLSAFALGLVLFIVTLTLNVMAALIIRRFRQRYE